ncbi:hypothetical protein VT06_06415 [Arsukibacterium sp. MJ3]|uniref:DUF6136 family protein n=1 Tax=Arsukibacterium sp. MJ3 TaxID=1632859 RepID=UPI000627278C|nr:DUF6136 family protein [Arsukibacterium sp. MJ3]KKO49461.1 hypothetical protein VT06_06415 [Arsukibacterium sp. MJ3]
MRFSLYVAFRFRCFKHELTLLLQQLSQLLLWLLVFLGPALAALVFTIFLALGLLYQTDTPARQQILLCWALLCGQSLLIGLYRDAIIGSRYLLFLQSLAPSKSQRRTADLLLLFCSQPILMCHLLMLSMANFSQWPGVLPQLFLLPLQWLYAVTLLYCGSRVLVILALNLPLLLILAPTSLAGGLVLLACGLVLALVWPGNAMRCHFRTTSPLRFWLRLWLNQTQQLLSRILLLLLVLTLALISIKQRPDLSAGIALLCGLLLLLISCSMQLSNNKFINMYAMFFRQYPPQLCHWQFLAPLLLAAVSISLLCLLTLQWPLSWKFLPALVICLGVARYQPQWFIAGWLAGSAISSGLFIFS